MDEIEFTERELQDIEDFIYGRTMPFFGKGITTHIKTGSERSDRMHAICVVLQDQGRIKPHYVYLSSVVWLPTEPSEEV